MRNRPLTLVFIVLSAGATAASPTEFNQSTPRSNLHSGDFQGPEACGKCHPRHYLEWRGSAHAYSAVDPIFQACNANALMQTGGQIGKLCMGCHAPVGARTGELSATLEKFDAASRVVQAGVSCEVCHRMEEPSPDAPIGNASFRLATRNVAYGRLAKPAPTSAHTSETNQFIARGEFCGSCHDVLQHGEPIEKTYAEWNESEYRTVRQHRCQDCHMLRYSGQAAVGGAFRETLHRHNFPAVTVALIDFPNQGFQAEQLQDFLRSAAVLSVSSPRQVQADGILDLSVSVKNSGTGHNLPSGLSTFRQMWVEVTVKDSDNNVVFRSGDLDANGDLKNGSSELDPNGDPSLVEFSDRFVDEKNNSVRFFFEASRVVERSLRPLEERASPYQVHIPQEALGKTLRCRVRLLFRSYPPYGLRFLGLGALVDRLPIWVMSSYTSESIPIVAKAERETEYEVPGDFPDLHTALDAAHDGDTLWVAPGKYTLERSLDFGGKDVTLKSRAGASKTTLQLAATHTLDEEASVVVCRRGETRDAVLDGFTIIGGRGTLVDGVRRGGGIYIAGASPTLLNNRIVDCGVETGLGGGVYVEDGTPTLLNNRIYGCWAEKGGAMAWLSSSTGPWTLATNAFTGNVSSLGGALYIDSKGELLLDRVLIAGNRAKENGAALYHVGSGGIEINHATVVHNTADAADGNAFGDEQVDRPSPPTVTNSIFWSNAPSIGTTRITYSLLDTKSDAPSNITEGFPLFRDPGGFWSRIRRSRENRRGVQEPSNTASTPLRERWTNGDYTLLLKSPAIDAGDPSSPADPDDTRTDLGAFFFEQPLKAFVRGDASGDGVVDWSDFVLVVEHVAGQHRLPCHDAADTDDSGEVNQTDVAALAAHLFSGTLAPAQPFPNCGLDPTFGDALSCDRKALPCLGLPESG